MEDILPTRESQLTGRPLTEATNSVTFRKLCDTSFPLSLPPSAIVSVISLHPTTDVDTRPVCPGPSRSDEVHHPGHTEVMEGEIYQELEDQASLWVLRLIPAFCWPATGIRMAGSSHARRHTLRHSSVLIRLFECKHYWHNSPQPLLLQEHIGCTQKPRLSLPVTIIQPLMY